MVKAIIFDCFGVLTTEGWLGFKRKHFKGNKTVMDEATEIRRQADSGLLGHNDFIRHVAELAGVSEADVRLSVDRSVPNDELFSYIREHLKPRYKVGLLTNTGRNVLQELFEPADAGLFDAAAMSYETGVTKPHPTAYEAIAYKLGVEPESCIFVDDKESYCRGARDAGMQTILYVDFEQFREELENILGDPKN